MAENQAYLFLIFTIDGFLIGLIFDFFRILRKEFKTSNIVTYIEDILFWILTGLIVLISMILFSNGTIRFYMLIGIIIGFITYILTLSKLLIKMSVFIIDKIKGTIKFIFSIIFYPIKIIYEFLYKIVKKLCNLLFKFAKTTEKNIKKVEKSDKKRRIFKRNVEK